MTNMLDRLTDAFHTVLADRDYHANEGDGCTAIDVECADFIYVTSKSLEFIGDVWDAVSIAMILVLMEEYP
jgi:hypothetical protein